MKLRGVGRVKVAGVKSFEPFIQVHLIWFEPSPAMNLIWFKHDSLAFPPTPLPLVLCFRFPSVKIEGVHSFDPFIQVPRVCCKFGDFGAGPGLTAWSHHNGETKKTASTLEGEDAKIQKTCSCLRFSAQGPLVGVRGFRWVKNSSVKSPDF